MRTIQIHDAQAYPADLKRQRENRARAGVNGARGKHWPASHGRGAGQIAGQGRPACGGIDAGTFTEGQGQLFQLGGDWVTGVDRLAWSRRQRHRDRTPVDTDGRDHRGRDVRDRDQIATGLRHDQTP